MPQPLLPLVRDGATPLSKHISVVNENDTWTYFAGVLPVFSHPADDRDSFRMFTAQLVCNGNCKQVDIVKPSETMGMIYLPIDIARSILAIPAEAIKLHVEIDAGEPEIGNVEGN